MPIYEYEILEGHCDECPGRFEARQRITDPPLTKCPKCDKPVRRLISRVSVVSVEGPSKLKELGMTRLVKRDQGVYEIEGAESGILDVSNQAEQLQNQQRDEPNRYDITPDMPQHHDSPKDEPLLGKEAPLKKSSKKQSSTIPFYDLINPSS